MAASKRIWLARFLTMLGIGCLGYYGYIAASAAVFHREQLHRLEALRASQASARTARSHPRRHASTPGVLTDTSTRFALLPTTARPSKTASSDCSRFPDWASRRRSCRATMTRRSRSRSDICPIRRCPGSRGTARWPRIAMESSGRSRTCETVTASSFAPRAAISSIRCRTLQIVRPTDLSVLEPLGADALTLITCYPFNYIGSAPKRFIVHAIRTAGPMTGDDGLLRSRSLSTMARYSAATARGPHVATNQTTGERRQASLQRSAPSRARVVRAQKANAARVGARRADASAAARKRNGRDALTGDREKSPAATKDKKATDEALASAAGITSSAAAEPRSCRASFLSLEGRVKFSNRPSRLSPAGGGQSNTATSGAELPPSHARWAGAEPR